MQINSKGHFKEKQYDAKKKTLHLVEPSDAISNIKHQFKQEVLGQRRAALAAGSEGSNNGEYKRKQK